MMTVVTEVELAEGMADEWDAIMASRMRGAEAAAGWIAGQVLASTDRPSRRVIVGVWESVEDWHAWHHDPRFRETRDRLDELGAAPGETAWYRTTYLGGRLAGA